MLDHENGYFARGFAPLMKTPISDFMLNVRNFQCRTDCAPYELMYVDCMEAYGYHQGKQKCRLIMEDLYECIYNIKRLRRVAIMRDERDRQINSGEKKEGYPESPALDLY